MSTIVERLNTGKWKWQILQFKAEEEQQNNPELFMLDKIALLQVCLCAFRYSFLEDLMRIMFRGKYDAVIFSPSLCFGIFSFTPVAIKLLKKKNLKVCISKTL